MKKGSSSLLQRLLTAAVVLPTVLFLLFKGGWWFFVPVFLLMTVATWEYVRMLRRLEYHPPYAFAILIVWSTLLSFFLSAQRYLEPLFGFLLLLSLSWHVVRDRTPTPVENWLLPLAGALYIGWTGGHVLLILTLPQGSYRLFAAFGMVWLADSAAYFAGKAWGKHPLSPRLSPKKTWEGYVAGIVAAVVLGPVLTGLGGFGWGHGAILGLVLATVSPVGDLGVSMIKRGAGVKDTGNLLPGHGGAFDRMDSLLVAAIIGYYYYVWVMGVPPVG